MRPERHPAGMGSPHQVGDARCVATQKIGPPSSVIVPKVAKTYSIQSGTLYERCVRSL